MDQQSLVSIIIPVYNVQQYLKRCLDSVVGQTYPNIEPILIDDGSTDGSGEICDEYQKKDSRFKVIHQPNGGVSAARNCGLDNCNGDFIMFIDADDWVEADYIERMVKYISNRNDTIFFSMFKSGLDVHTFDNVKIYTGHYNDMLFKNGIDIGWVWAGIFPKAIVNGIRFLQDVSVGEDIAFICTCACNAAYISYVKYNGYHYDCRPNSAVHGSFSEKSLTELQAYHYIFNLFFNEKEILMRAKAHYARRLFFIICQYYDDKQFKSRYFKIVFNEYKSYYRNLFKIERNIKQLARCVMMRLCPDYLIKYIKHKKESRGRSL